METLLINKYSNVISLFLMCTQNSEPHCLFTSTNRRISGFSDWD